MDDSAHLKKGEVKVITADLVAASRFKPEEYGGACSIVVQQQNAGAVILVVRTEMISQLANAAAFLGKLAQQPRPDWPGGPMPKEGARYLQVDGAALVEPGSIGAPAASAVLRIETGHCIFDFAAPPGLWRGALAALGGP